jgi:hypothetical protein
MSALGVRLLGRILAFESHRKRRRTSDGGGVRKRKMWVGKEEASVTHKIPRTIYFWPPDGIGATSRSEAEAFLVIGLYIFYRHVFSLQDYYGVRDNFIA